MSQQNQRVTWLKQPTPPTMVTVNVPNKPVSPKELVAPKVKWHKNYAC